MPVLLAILAVCYAQRFLVFLTPVIALGLGFLVAETCARFERYKIVYVLPLFFVYFTWKCLSPSLLSTPLIPLSSIKGMEVAKSKTPEDAVIWSWCDNGYPLIYWARRSTICDGQIHDGERSVYTTIPLATHDPRLAANFIRFYISRGVKGIHSFYETVENDRDKGLTLIKEILSAGPDDAYNIIERADLREDGQWRTNEDWLRFFYPVNSRPIYLFLDQEQIQKSFLITWLGTWSIKEQDGFHSLTMKITRDVTVSGNIVTNRNRTMLADLKQGVVSYRNKKPVSISSATLTTAEGSVRYEYKPVTTEQADVFSSRKIKYSDNNKLPTITRGKYHLEIFEPEGYAVLMSQEVAEGMLNKLFWRNSLPLAEYFRPVIMSTPDYQLWEVGGDNCHFQISYKKTP